MRRAEPSYALLYEETPLTLELRDQRGWQVVAQDVSALGRPVVLLHAPDRAPVE